MKHLIYIFLFTFSLSCFSQKSGEIKLTKEKITSAKIIQDLISDIPKDCKITSFIFSGTVGGRLIQVSNTNAGLATETKTLMGSFEKGKWFFIEKINSSCVKSHKESYKIIVE